MIDFFDAWWFVWSCLRFIFKWRNLLLNLDLHKFVDGNTFGSFSCLNILLFINQHPNSHYHTDDKVIQCGRGSKNFKLNLILKQKLFHWLVILQYLLMLQNHHHQLSQCLFANKLKTWKEMGKIPFNWKSYWHLFHFTCVTSNASGRPILLYTGINCLNFSPSGILHTCTTIVLFVNKDSIYNRNYHCKNQNIHTLPVEICVLQIL